MTRIPLDQDDEAYGIESSACFICEIVSGDSAHNMERVVAEDTENIAFLSRNPPSVQRHKSEDAFHHV